MSTLNPRICVSIPGKPIRYRDEILKPLDIEPFRIIVDNLTRKGYATALKGKVIESALRADPCKYLSIDLLVSAEKNHLDSLRNSLDRTTENQEDTLFNEYPPISSKYRLPVSKRGKLYVITPIWSAPFLQKPLSSVTASPSPIVLHLS